MTAHGPRWQRRIAGIVASAMLLAQAPLARAENPPRTTVSTATPEAQAAARDHFPRARALYAQGAYRVAITELEAALALDPDKNLVFNLGVVNEKLGNIDEALRHFRRYVEMDVTEQERAKAESFIKRLEGAKREVKPEDRAKDGTQPPPPPPPPNETPAAPPPHGRIDVLTITAAAITVGAVAVGTIFGVKATNDNPPTNGPWSSYNAYISDQNQAQNAHREARVSDIAFVVGGVGAAATALLFFLRTKDPKAQKSPAVGGVRASVSVFPLTSGGAAFVGGSF
jgi:tetratricopeptide (TPR) repeat protein